MKNIVETAIDAGEFKTLVKAVQEAGLVEALSGEKKLTVFAPTDKAFAKIPKKDLEALLKNKEALKKVLLYHVVEGEVSSGKARELKEAKSLLEGEELNFSKKGLINRCFAVGNACIIGADIKASNGTIHIIDNVLMPAM
jgi:uncharacterized surface protein with fasciclin (FAS1) repeats